MKYFTLVAIALTLTFHAFSQDKGYLAINIGPSIPTGDFGSNNINNEEAGFANSGIFVDLSFNYKLGTYFGISAMLRTQSNTYNTGPLEEELHNINPSIEWIIDSKPWSCQGFLAGFYSSFPIRQSTTSFEGRVLAGFMNCRMPDLSVSVVGLGNYLFRPFETSRSTTFAYLLDACFRFNVSNRMFLKTGIDYLGMTPEFKLTDSFSGETTKFDQPISTINIGVGIGVKFR